MTRYHEDESCSKVLSFLGRLDDRIGCAHEETVAAVREYYHHHHQSLNREGHWGPTDDFATSFLHVSLFSNALWDLPNSRPVHPLMLPSHLFLCLPCLLPPFAVPCKMVLARPDERPVRRKNHIRAKQIDQKQLWKSDTLFMCDQTQLWKSDTLFMSHISLYV